MPALSVNLREPGGWGGAGTAIRLLQRAGEAALTGARVRPLSVAALRTMSSERMRPARYRRHLTRAKQPRCIKPGFYHGGRFSNTSGRIWSPSQLRATRHCLRQPTESDSGGRTSVIHYENMGAYRPKNDKKKKRKKKPLHGLIIDKEENWKREDVSLFTCFH